MSLFDRADLGPSGPGERPAWGTRGRRPGGEDAKLAKQSRTTASEDHGIRQFKLALLSTLWRSVLDLARNLHRRPVSRSRCWHSAHSGLPVFSSPRTGSSSSDSPPPKGEGGGPHHIHFSRRNTRIVPANLMQFMTRP